jgi:hypothetical protein
VSDAVRQLSEMRALLKALEGGTSPNEFEHKFRDHMHAIWSEIDRAGLMTVELRHAHTNLAEALDFFDLGPQPSTLDAVRSRFVVYEGVVTRSQQPTNDR